MKNRGRDLVRLRHMLDSVESILKFSKNKSLDEFEEDIYFQSAVIRQFEVMGEASVNVSQNLKSQFPDVEWEKMKRFRNFLIHEYFRIDNSQVWATIQEDLPLVKEQLKNIIEDLTK